MASKYTKQEVIRMVRDYYNKHGKIVIRDLKNKNGLPSVGPMIKLFGTFENLLREANIDIPEDKAYNFGRVCLSDTELLKLLNDFTKKHLKSHIFLPTYDDIENCSALPSCSTYTSRFKSIESAFHLIGYDIQEFNNSALEKDMISKYNAACRRYGCVLNSRQITKLSKMNKSEIYATETYANHFGSISNLQKMCGYDPTTLGKIITKEESIEALRKIANELDRSPFVTDLPLVSYAPNAGYYRKMFGSWNKALKAAGLSPANKIRTTSKGTLCLSSFEYKIACVLESYNIPFEKEVSYKSVISNFEKGYRFDFVIESNGVRYYVEIFGIMGSEDYQIKTNEKISLCQANNIPLISLYQKDIYGKTNQEIYDLLTEKIASFNRVAA